MPDIYSKTYRPRGEATFGHKVFRRVDVAHAAKHVARDGVVMPAVQDSKSRAIALGPLDQIPLRLHRRPSRTR